MVVSKAHSNCLQLSDITSNSIQFVKPYLFFASDLRSCEEAHQMLNLLPVDLWIYNCDEDYILFCYNFGRGKAITGCGNSSLHDLYDRVCIL